MYTTPKVVKLSKSEARWKYGVWIGSVEASDEHLIGIPLGVVKAMAAEMDRCLRPRRSVRCTARRGDHQRSTEEPRSEHA